MADPDAAWEGEKFKLWQDYNCQSLREGIIIAIAKAFNGLRVSQIERLQFSKNWRNGIRLNFIYFS